ncbi:MAG: AgmX/PglI C-terminal domain-containing protein [Myxococcota bacterium]
MSCPGPTKLLALADGELFAGARARVEAHVGGCAPCAARLSRVDLARAELRALRDADPPELGWRRIEAQIHWNLAPRPAARRWPTWLAAAACAAGLVVCGFWAARLFPRDASSMAVVPPARAIPAVAALARTPASFEGVPTLVEGSVALVRGGRVEPLSAETRVRAGDRLVAHAGRAAIQTEAQTVFEVRPQSTVDVKALAPAWHELVLAQGEVVCRVGKRRAGERFAVVAAGREVRVRGTLFGVRRGAGEVEVVLQEGSVEIADIGSGGAPLRLRAPARVLLRDGQAAASAQVEAMAGAPLDVHLARALGGAAPLAGDGAFGSLLSVPRPAGATVLVDGVAFGLSPLALRLPPGPHLLRVERRGFDPFEETIELGPRASEIAVSLVSRSSAPTDRFAQVAAVVRSRTPELRACYERLLKRGASVEARIAIDLTVDTSGRVTRTSVLADPVVRRCVERAVRRWQFGPGSSASLTLPIAFRPGS